jgi:hypothetical protein
MTLQLIVPVTHKHLSMRAHSIDAGDKPNEMRPRSLIFLDNSLKKASLSLNELSSIPLCKVI